MKIKTLAATLMAGFMCQLGSAQDIDSMAPVVVKTVPEAGSKDVKPGTVEIKVTFSKDMADQSWSWCSAWENSDPKGVGKPHYAEDQRTCILKVKLEPNKTYGYWLNSQRFHGFQDTAGHTAIPYFLVFHTSDK